MNVNLQMNYWPTYSTNLAECALPLIDYIDSLREPGRITANPFTDVPAGAWYEAAVNWAAENSVAVGTGDGAFGVGVICNRAQAVTFLRAVFDK